MPDLSNAIMVAGPTRISMVSLAELVVPVIEDREVAWAGAKAMMKIREDRGYLMGRFLGTGFANSNGHVFDLEQVRARHQDVVHTPLNVLHHANHIIGTYMATELIEPDEAAAATIKALAGRPARAGDMLPVHDKALGGPGDGLANPYVEALAAVHRYHMPVEWAACMTAHAAGQLFFSMEAVPDAVICPTCQVRAVYTGPQDDAYCDHMNAARGPKQLDNPLFIGGAAVLPPGRPGWRDANVMEFASLLDSYVDEADRVYQQVVGMHAHLDGRAAERLTAALLGGVFDDRPEARMMVAPMWDRMSAGLDGLDMVPPENVRSAIAVALSMVDTGTVPAVEIARAEAAARGVPQSPFMLRRWASATATDAGLMLAGGQAGQEWARDRLAEVHQRAVAETAKIEALLSEVTDAAMIALVPSEADAAKLVLADVHGALPAGEQHLTLRYLGKVANLTNDALDAAGRAFRSAAACARGPIEGQVSGVGELGNQGAVVLFLNIDVDDLVDEINWKLDVWPADASPLGYPPAPPNFLPHVTIGYPTSDADREAMLNFARGLTGMKIVFDRVAMVVGGEASIVALAAPGSTSPPTTTTTVRSE